MFIKFKYLPTFRQIIETMNIDDEKFEKIFESSNCYSKRESLFISNIQYLALVKRLKYLKFLKNR